MGRQKALDCKQPVIGLLQLLFHICLHSIPDVTVLLARTSFTTSRKSLLDTHLFSGSAAAARDGCLANFNFLCHSSRTGSFYGPEELKQCSHMFSG
jgi:hypothetical protein